MSDTETFTEAMMRSWQMDTGGKSFVLFSSPTCAPCRRFKNTIERMEAADARSRGIFYVNVYHAAAVAVESKIRAVPTLIRFESGKEVGRLTGEHSETEVKEFFDA